MSLHAKINGAWQEIPDAERLYAKVAGHWSVIGTDLPGYNDATGGDVTTYTRDGKWFRVHTFTGTDATGLTVISAPNPFRILLVGAGDNGGGGSSGASGGGGNGGRSLADDAASLAVGSHPVTVGASSGADTSLGSVTTVGGTAGGSGGPGRGDPGGAGDGNRVDGAPGSGGFTSDITGTVLGYCGGGGGGGYSHHYQSGVSGGGGVNGGGNGGGGGANCCMPPGCSAGDAGAANRGGGGGGGGVSQSTATSQTSACGGGAGASGVVIVSYEIAPPVFNDATGGTVTEVENYLGTGEKWRVHTFTPGSSTFEVAVSLHPFRWLATGGGGGGGRTEGGASCGGGNAASAAADDASLAVGTYAVSVGNSGAAGIYGTDLGNGMHAGGNGGTTTFGTLANCGGGQGGPYNGGNRGGGSPRTSDISGASVTYCNGPATGGLNPGGGGSTPTGMGPYGGAAGGPGVVIVAYRIG